MKSIIICALSISVSYMSYGQEILLKGDSTSMVNLYGDARLLSVDMQKSSKAPTTYIANGHRIQLGSFVNRKDAERLRAQVVKKYPKEFIIMKYDEPNYKILLGNFIHVETANTALEKFIKIYPQAIIIPDKIQITANKK